MVEAEIDNTLEYIIYIICSAIIAAFTIIMIIIYSRDENFNIDKTNSEKAKIQSYPRFFNIFFCCVITVDNLIRIIPKSFGVDPSNEKDQANFICGTQAFILCLTDKFLPGLMTIYSIMNYLSVFKGEFYKNNLFLIYLSLILGGFFISLTLTIIYFTYGVSYKDILCYIHTRELFKIISDDIYTSILFIINLFCLINLIKKMHQLENKYQNSDKLIQKEKSKSFLRRFIIHLIINIIAFTYIFLLINKTFPKGSYKDLIYILICLIVELFFTVQRPLYKAFMRILTCNKIEKFKEINKVTEDEEYDNENNNEES